MKEEQINALREQDLNLRDALRLDEAELPQMPTDLNARVMQRVADEQKRTRKATVRRIWPWVAAACVAAFIVVNIAPPKDTVTPQDKGQVAEKVESKQEKEEQPKAAEAEKPQLAEVKTVKKAGAAEAIVKNRNELAVNPAVLDCDYYRFAELDAGAVNAYQNEYMSQYYWAEFFFDDY